MPVTPAPRHQAARPSPSGSAHERRTACPERCPDPPASLPACPDGRIARHGSLRGCPRVVSSIPGPPHARLSLAGGRCRVSRTLLHQPNARWCRLYGPSPSPHRCAAARSWQHPLWWGHPSAPLRHHGSAHGRRPAWIGRHSIPHSRAQATSRQALSPLGCRRPRTGNPNERAAIAGSSAEGEILAEVCRQGPLRKESQHERS